MPASVKNLVYLSFIIVGLSLSVVLVLGVRHYRLTTQYADVNVLLERTLFAFDTIREQAGEAMITGDSAALKSLIPDIEQLNTQVLRLYDHPAIPANYRLAMAEGLDLSGLVIGLRRLESTDEIKTARLEQFRAMRRVRDTLLGVDRIITSSIRDSVIAFQLTVIGTMGFLISCASFVLIVLYKRGVSPLLHLSSQAGAARSGDLQAFSYPSDSATEIAAFVDSVNELLADAQSRSSSTNQGDVPGSDQLQHTINETANRLNAVINYGQLLLESGSLTDKQREMLTEIVASGERIGESWRSISSNFDG